MANAIITYRSRFCGAPFGHNIVDGREYHTLEDSDAVAFFGTFERQGGHISRSNRFPLTVFIFKLPNSINPQHTIIENAIIFFSGWDVNIRNIHFKNCLFSAEQFRCNYIEFNNCQFDDCAIVLEGRPKARPLFFNCAFISTQLYANINENADLGYNNVGFHNCIFVDPLQNPGDIKLSPYYPNGLTESGEHTVWKLVKGIVSGQRHIVLLRCTLEEGVKRIPCYECGTSVEHQKLRCEKVRVEEAFLVGDIVRDDAYPYDAYVHMTTDASQTDDPEGTFVTFQGHTFYVRPMPEAIRFASFYDISFEYTIGATVKADYWNPDRYAICSGGIHVFLSCVDALEYNRKVLGI